MIIEILFSNKIQFFFFWNNSHFYTYKNNNLYKLLKELYE
jgi:hypothetical protein